jgi:hypothetical protein
MEVFAQPSDVIAETRTLGTISIVANSKTLENYFHSIKALKNSEFNGFFVEPILNQEELYLKTTTKDGVYRVLLYKADEKSYYIVPSALCEFIPSTLPSTNQNWESVGFVGDVIK